MNVKVGDEIPELVKQPTTRQLVQYAGASGDFYEIHYDQEVARSTGLPGVILHGLLKAGFRVRSWNWTPEKARVLAAEGRTSPRRPPTRCARPRS